MKPPIPKDEENRIQALHRYEILDTPSEQEYDDVILLASQICGTPIALISLVDEDRQWFKAKIGLDVSETPRDLAFCAHAILDSPETLVVGDALKDKRFANNPLVIGDPKIRFYAGAPLITPDNQALGTLCVIDRKPRKLTEKQIESLQALARQVTMQMELRRTSALLQSANEKLSQLSLEDALTELYNRRGFLVHTKQQLRLFRSRRLDRGLWLMMADMDGLKEINDTFGHQEGSLALVKIGEILQETFRETDVIARFGGDEFTVLFIDIDNEVGGTVSERLEKNLEVYNANSGKIYKLSISYGLISIGVEDNSSIEELINQADKLMYEQKRSKKKLNI